VDVPHYAGEWGTSGSGNSQFLNPSGIANIGSSIYVCDRGNNRVQVFSEYGNYEKQFAVAASPQGIGGQTSYVVYVTFASYAAWYDMSGAGGTPSLQAVSASVLSGAWGGCAVMIGSSIYYAVPDTDNDNVKRFTVDLSSYLSFGSSGSGTGQMDGPYAIAPDKPISASSSYFYVADSQNNRVEKFTAAGAHVLTWGSTGTTDGHFNIPCSIAVDSLGFVYVGDFSNRIQKFDSSGNFLGKWGSSGTGNSQFDIPVAIAIYQGSANGDSIYVADMYNNRIQKFIY
jgi:tripartite motif-containing protein 71